jgi:hypothetical protein
LFNLASRRALDVRGAEPHVHGAPEGKSGVLAVATEVLAHKVARNWDNICAERMMRSVGRPRTRKRVLPATRTPLVVSESLLNGGRSKEDGVQLGLPVHGDNGQQVRGVPRLRTQENEP